MKALKGKCIHMMDKIINIVLQRSLQKIKIKILLNWGICSFSSCTSGWRVLSSTWAVSPSPGTSSANNSSVVSEGTGWTEVWAGASMLMLDKSRSGWEALTWRRQSSKPSTNEPPNSTRKASKSRYSHIASSFTWRSRSLAFVISFSLSARTFYNSSVYFSNSFLWQSKFFLLDHLLGLQFTKLVLHQSCLYL